MLCTKYWVGSCELISNAALSQQLVNYVCSFKLLYSTSLHLPSFPAFALKYLRNLSLLARKILVSTTSPTLH